MTQQINTIILELTWLKEITAGLKTMKGACAKLFLTGAIARQIEEDAYEAASFPPPSDPSPSEKKANAAKKSLAQLAKALTPGGTGEEGSKKKKKGEKKKKKKKEKGITIRKKKKKKKKKNI